MSAFDLCLFTLLIASAPPAGQKHNWFALGLNRLAIGCFRTGLMMVSMDVASVLP